ncbi:MAG TPA: ATP-binding protein [Vicinamibacteria bacterium]
MSARAALGGRVATALLPLAALLVALGAAGAGRPFLLAAAVFALAAAWRTARFAPAGLVAAALLAAVSAQVHLRLEERRWRAHSERRVAESLRDLQQRADRLVGLLAGVAARVAALPDAPPALAGDRAARIRLFRALEDVRPRTEERPAVGVDTPQLQTVAWIGRLGNTAALRGLLTAEPDVFVLEGNVTTTLVAHAPVGRPAGLAGHAIASFPIAVRRNISNEYLRDYDRVAAGDPRVEVRYADARADGVEGFPPLDPALVAREGVLRAPDGGLLAAVRVTAPALPAVQKQLAQAYHRAVSALLLAAAVAALWPGRRRPLDVLLFATAVRGLVALLGPPWPGPGSRVLSAEVYASPLLGPLLRSPLDLLLTAAWAAVGALALWHAAVPFLERPRGRLVLLLPVAAIPVVLGLLFGLFADTLANTALDLEVIPLLPRSAAHLVMQTALLCCLCAAFALLATALAAAGPLPPHAVPAALRLGAAALVALASWAAARAVVPAFPLGPALALVLGAALAAGLRGRWHPWLRGATAGAHAALLPGALAALGLVLYPTLVSFAAAATSARIERDHAPVVLRQPQWRDYVLQETRRRIDSLRVLEEAPPGSALPGAEELAFAVWSATDLAAFGFSSAVEVQDPSGAVISRFALNLPSLSDPPQGLPPEDEWQVSPERVTLASAERTVLHARRRLTYHGEVHGAAHVYVADDFWNLPFLRGRDPYSVLFRTASRAAARERDLALVVYDPARAAVFSSVERPPALDPALVARVPATGGLWTRLTFDGQPHRAYLFRGPGRLNALAYPELTRERYAGDLVEAAVAFTVAGLAALLLVLLARTVLTRPSLSFPAVARAVKTRYALRVFVAFIVVAALPVFVLQAVVRDFLTERLEREFQEQARERAAIAKKAVEDLAFFQRGAEGGAGPVTDAALVWLSSVIRNDLDVFEGGRLRASSKRELYASGLLAPRVSGVVFRQVILEGEPSYLRTERIGDFAYQVATVPVRLQTGEPGVLSLPLALRQREVVATVEDLDRTVRLAAVGFLVLAAALAQSLARRISGPISELTRATRRVAQGDLHARVEARSHDELRQLVESFNQMAGDLERQRRDLERSNRLAAWAEMARQVAHEVKNPLTPIQLSAEHLRRVYRDPGVDFERALESCTQTILKQVGNLRGIVTEFSSFARPPAAVLEPQDPAELAAEVVRPYQTALPPGVALTLRAAPGLPQVLADRRLVHRALLNLVENALQAVADAGTVEVTVREEGGQVEFAVTDSGPGISPEMRARVFEPFFSTKTSGSGLGLALVKKIVEDHGGGIALEDAPGHGTRARLWLPVHARPNVA